MEVSLSIALPLILASASPRRQELLRDAGFDFSRDPADIDESDYPAEIAPIDLPVRLARLKAQAVVARHTDAVILAADTIVAIGTEIIGKPVDADHARQILVKLSGSVHHVHSGVAVARGEKIETILASSTVRMRELLPNEIENYIASGEWRGKAGGYGVQDNDPIATHLSGSRTNVVGLPMDETIALLARFGISPNISPAPQPTGSEVRETKVSSDRAAR